MKKLYIAFITEETENHLGKTGRYYNGGIIQSSEQDNILTRLQIRGVIAANVFTTQKAAVEAVKGWRAAWRENGTYYWEG